VVSAINAISVISNEKSLSLFKAVALSENYDSKMLMTKLNFSRRQYYIYMKKLVDVGLIKRSGGKYRITLFGKVVFNAYAKIETVVKDYWKLKALELMMGSVNSRDLSIQERQMVIDKLIDNPEIKDTLVQIEVQRNL
jgi:predicted transcriptional regulator